MCCWTGQGQMGEKSQCTGKCLGITQIYLPLYLNIIYWRERSNNKGPLLMKICNIQCCRIAH